MDREEWHYYSDQFDARETGEHGWRKSNVKPKGRVLQRNSTHQAGSQCNKLCVDGLWPIPRELTGVKPPTGPGPFGFTTGEFACSWYVTENGRIFKLIRHHGNNYNLVVEIAWQIHQPYSWVPSYPKTQVWDWVGIQSI